MTFEVYERDTDQDFRVRKRDVTLVADQQLEVRDEKDPKGFRYTFHPKGNRRFLVQRSVGNYYACSTLEIDNGEYVLTWLDCSKIDQGAFRAAGGSVVKHEGSSAFECQLDSASKPIKLLNSVATRASCFQQRYVPVLALHPDP